MLARSAPAPVPRPFQFGQQSQFSANPSLRPGFFAPRAPPGSILRSMAVLSVDLAFRRWSDLGIVVLSHASPLPNPSVTCEIISLEPPGFNAVHDRAPIDPEILAGRLNHLCAVRNIRILMLDGPQAWKSAASSLKHARVSERHLNTSAKTGLPGMVKPATYRSFTEFCMDVYDALCRRGWRRLRTRPQPDAPELQAAPLERVLVESYPHAAWKSLELKPLPAKRRARVSDLAEAYAALRAVVPFTTNRPPNHDQLQAIVGGLPGLALEEHNPAAMRIVGNPPHREQGHWREGFIVLPLPPRAPSSVRWLH